MTAITATQKTILNALGLDANNVKHYAAELSQTLKGANRNGQIKNTIVENIDAQIEKA